MALAVGLATSTGASAAGCIVQTTPPPQGPITSNTATADPAPTGEQGDLYADMSCWGFNDDGECVAFVFEGGDDHNYQATDECVRWEEPTGEDGGWGATEECNAWLFEPSSES